MNVDRDPLGEGPYPLTGPWAVFARVAFFGSLAAILIAVFLPARMVPQFVRSHYLQHFAAFYVATLFGMAAAPRAKLRSVSLWLLTFGTAVELSHLAAGAPLKPLIDNWVADVGGVVAALAPAFIERFRRRFPPRLSDVGPSIQKPLT